MNEMAQNESLWQAHEEMKPHFKENSPMQNNFPNFNVPMLCCNHIYNICRWGTKVFHSVWMKNWTIFPPWWCSCLCIFILPVKQKLCHLLLFFISYFPLFFLSFRDFASNVAQMESTAQKLDIQPSTTRFYPLKESRPI